MRISLGVLIKVGTSWQVESWETNVEPVAVVDSGGDTNDPRGVGGKCTGLTDSSSQGATTTKQS